MLSLDRRISSGTSNGNGRNRDAAAMEPLESRTLLAAGLRGDYYDDLDFQGYRFSRAEAVDFNWDRAAPTSSMGADTFSVRWSGKVIPRYSQTYRFYTRSDDGVRLWVNGTQLVNNWTDHASREDSGTVTLQAGQKYDITMEYYERTGGAIAQLLWSSSSQAKQVIPTSQLTDESAVPLTGTPSAAPLPGSTGNGLAGTYYDNADLTAPKLTRAEAVHFSWGTGSPAASIGADTFSARWTGQIVAPATDTYTFSTTSDDGVRLWVGGVQLVNNWTAHGPTVDTGSIRLEAGKRYDVKLEYYENTGGATMQLAWASSSFSTTTVPVSALFSPVASPSVSTFPVFDAMLFQNKPDLSGEGLEPIYVGYFSAFFASGSTGATPDEAVVRATARKVSDLGQILVIDIEHWPTDIRSASEADVAASVEKFLRIINWIRDERPDVKLGLYGILPVANYTDVVRNSPLDPWRAANDRLGALASAVDFLFPGLYTVYDDIGGWRKYALAVVEEAKRMNKPVYPFIWMDYHDMNPTLGLQPLPAIDWGVELQTLRSTADGVVIWGGHQKQWDPQSEWWRVTREFTSELPESIVAPSALSATAATGKITLSWTDNSGNERGFLIERSSNGLPFTALAAVGAGVKQYVDLEVADAAYSYRVSAIRWTGESDVSNTVTARPVRDAKQRLEAEKYLEMNGLAFTTSTIGGLDHNDWVRYGKVDFGAGVRKFTARLAVPETNAGQKIELRRGDIDGPLIGSLVTRGTGGWYAFTEQSMSIKLLTGVHELYLVFNGGSGVANLDWFIFS